MREQDASLWSQLLYHILVLDLGDPSWRKIARGEQVSP